MGKEMQRSGPPILTEVSATAGDSRILRWLRRQLLDRPEGPCLWISVHRSNPKHTILDEIAQFRVPSKIEEKRLCELADDIALSASDDACGPAAATEYVARDWHGKDAAEAKACSTCFFVPLDAPSAQTHDGEATAVALDLMIKHCEVQQRNNTSMMGIVLAHQSASLQIAETRAAAAEAKTERQAALIEEAAQKGHERQMEEARMMSDLNRQDQRSKMLDDGLRALAPHLPNWLGVGKAEIKEHGVDPYKVTLAKVVEKMPQEKKDALRALFFESAGSPQELSELGAALDNFSEHLAESKKANEKKPEDAKK
jgi:hypothetical protein